MPRVAMILSGCGVFDGSEIHESVLSYLALDKAGCKVFFFAPDMMQSNVVNHLSGSPVAREKRNVIVESARIARGFVASLEDLEMTEFEGLFFPGGFGVAKNLSNFASAGSNCEVDPQVARIIRQAHDSSKPIGAVCIAPILLARVLGEQVRVTLTIGNDSKTASLIEEMGCRHKECSVAEAVVDQEHKVVTAPAYMLAGSIAEASRSVEAAVDEFMRFF